MYLITGATGNIGRELVSQLLSQGEQVRVMTRDPGRAQIWAQHKEIVSGDFEDLESLKRALDGVEAVFLLTRGDEAGNAHIENFLAAASTQSSLKRVVLLSNLGAGLKSNPLSHGHAWREQRVKDSGLPLTVLRPGSFMSNTLRWASGIQRDGTVIHSNGQGRTAPIAPADIAAVAVRALTSGDWTGQTLELTGPEALTTPEQVNILSNVIGYPIKTLERDIPTTVQAMIHNGMPPDFAAAMGQVIEGLRRGEADLITDTVERVTGRAPQRFYDWAQERKQAWPSP